VVGGLVVGVVVAWVGILLQYFLVQRPNSDRLDRQERHAQIANARQTQQTIALALLTDVQTSLRAFDQRYLVRSRQGRATIEETSALFRAIRATREARFAVLGGRFERAIRTLRTTFDELESLCPPSDPLCAHVE
jgi:hypothetical protein